MTSSSPSSASSGTLSPPLLADRLVIACWVGDMQDVQAAITAGASVNERATAVGWRSRNPLFAAVYNHHVDVVVTLLARGADPNGYWVMHTAVCHGTADVLQLLIDAGGDVNAESCGMSPLYIAVSFTVGAREAVTVLLAQPTLRLTAAHDVVAPEQFARNSGLHELADTIGREVGTQACVCLSGHGV